jgi:hypothetical protein
MTALGNAALNLNAMCIPTAELTPESLTAAMRVVTPPPQQYLIGLLFVRFKERKTLIYLPHHSYPFVMMLCPEVIDKLLPSVSIHE